MSLQKEFTLEIVNSDLTSGKGWSEVKAKDTLKLKRSNNDIMDFFMIV